MRSLLQMFGLTACARLEKVLLLLDVLEGGGAGEGDA